MKELADKIIEDFTERMNQYPDSRFVSDEDITLAVLVSRIEDLQKECQNLKPYRNAINRIDDYFEYANESLKDREFIHNQLDAITEHLQRINARLK